MTEAGWKLVNEEPSRAHENNDSTILTFEEEDPTPGNEIVLTAEHVAEFLGSAIRRR
jgi:hypothetical protein